MKIMEKGVKLEDSRYKELLEKELFIYGNLIIKEGVILGNEFNYDIKSSQASTWIIENEAKVKDRIDYYLKASKVVGGDKEDCFNYAIYYFLDKKEREVVLNFFGDDTNYDIEKYCMSNLKFAVYGYKNSLNKLRGEGTTYLIDSKNVEDRGMGYSVEDVTYGNSITNSSNRFVDPYDSLEIKELKEEFKKELLMYASYFKEEGYRVFDLLNVFAYLFFNASLVDDDLGKSKEELRNKLYEITAENTGEPKLLIENVFNTLVKGFKNGYENETDIYKLVSLYISKDLKDIKYEVKEKAENWDNIEDMYY